MNIDNTCIIANLNKNLLNLKLFLCCKVCENIVLDPRIILQCGHTFCNKCLEDTRICPNCSAKFEPDDILFNHQFDYMTKCLFHIEDIVNKSQEQIETNIEFANKQSSNVVEPALGYEKTCNNSVVEEKNKIHENDLNEPNCIFVNISPKNDLYKRNLLGETDLQRACIQGKFELVKMLIIKGAEVNVVDNFKWSPLHEVAKNGHFDICELLLESGSIVDIPNVSYITPLYLAAEYKQENVAKLLLEYGADKNVITYDGDTPLMLNPNMTEIFENTNKIHNIVPSVYETNSIEIVFASNLKLNKRKHSFKISKSITDKTTHYVLNDNIVNHISVPLLKAIVLGLWIVDKQWYDEFIVNQAVDTRLFEAKWHYKYADELVFKKARLNRQMLQPHLFSGYKIYLHGNVYKTKSITINKQEMTDIIKAAGGEVMKRCPKPELVSTDKLQYPYHARKNKLNSCSHIIIYLTEKPYQPEYRFSELRTLSAQWIIQSIMKFKIIDPNEFTLVDDY